MEGCCTVPISSELRSLFPTLLHLSTKEVVDIWDAVSVYILEQLKLDKGVQVAGLGTFAVLREEFYMKGDVHVVRRPVFQVDMDRFSLGPTVLIPGDVKIKLLDYRWLSRATSFPMSILEGCVQETILLYYFQLRNRQHIDFSFRDIGILCCEGDGLCMRFYADCVSRLENKARHIALLHTSLWMPGAAVSNGATTTRGMRAAPDRVFPRFQIIVTSRSGATAPKKLLKKRERFCLPVLPSQHPGMREQEMGKKTSAIVLPPCPGSFPRTKELGKQEAAPLGKPSTALPAAQCCKKALQEVWQLSAQHEQVKGPWKEWRQREEAEGVAWEAWSAGKVEEPPQALGTGGTWTPHPPAQPRGMEETKFHRKIKVRLPAEAIVAAPRLGKLQPGLSPRAVQVLERLEPYHEQRGIYESLVAINRQKLEQQSQLPG